MTAQSRRRALGLVIPAIVACDRELPPAGQVVLYVDTDAIVPEADKAAADPSMLSALVDRARFEVLRDGEPLANSTRDVAIDAAMLRDKRLSFGVVPDPSLTGVSVRVRLFRADRVLDAEPPSGVTLDTTVALPQVARDGIIELNVLLRADDFGQRIGPVHASSGAPARSLVGSWRGGRRTPCADTASPDEACVAGGAFFFGNPRFRGRSQNEIVEERLVVLSPFFLDRTEVTVAAFRELWPSLTNVAEPVLADGANYCTWTAAPDESGDRRALNCVPWATAQAYCIARGKDLPSEAQFEFAGSGVGEEWAFPWGNDEADCAGVVWGCAGISTSSVPAIRGGSPACRQVRREVAPLPPGQGTSDRLGSRTLYNASGEVLDLAGNVAEWARDVWGRPTDSFWSGVRPLLDPVNVTVGADGDAHPVRGGDWVTSVIGTRTGLRRMRRAGEQDALVGFRCARADGRRP